MPFQRAIRFAVFALAVGILLIQFVPYGRNHTNPPVTQAPRWDNPRTEELASRACLDCHSNETRWPWYSSVAPVSWRIQSHVDEGREKLNLSQMDRPQEDAHEAAEAVSSGKMPPRDYLLAHPEARLTPAERAEFAQGLAATLGGESGREGRSGGHTEHDEGPEEGDDD